MRVAFFSNFVNHHQFSFCQEMLRLTDGNFVFVATEPFCEERRSFGYDDMDGKYDFVLPAYHSDTMKNKALQIAKTWDIAIFGSAPEFYLVERMKLGKVTFRYCERPLKEGRLRLLRPKTLYMMLKTHTQFMFKPLYLLCASSYTYGDCALVGGYWGRAYKWGYFPEALQYDTTALLQKKAENSIIKILWAGRLIGFKHPEQAIDVAEKLKNDGYQFELNIIGNGELEADLAEQIAKRNLGSCVKMLGSMNPQRVRTYMEEANIYLFTSDRNEGWGAVLNESMNSGCAVITNSAIGSATYLINDGVSGLLYREGDALDLYKKVKQCMDDRKYREELGVEAYRTITEVWSARVAAERIFHISEQLLKNNKVFYKSGPCSKAGWR